MNVKQKLAKVIINLSQIMAHKMHGSASTFGTYQPKEPYMMEK